MISVFINLHHVHDHLFSQISNQEECTRATSKSHEPPLKSREINVAIAQLEGIIM